MKLNTAFATAFPVLASPPPLSLCRSDPRLSPSQFNTAATLSGRLPPVSVGFSPATETRCPGAPPSPRVGLFGATTAGGGAAKHHIWSSAGSLIGTFILYKRPFRHCFIGFRKEGCNLRRQSGIVQAGCSTLPAVKLRGNLNRTKWLTCSCQELHTQPRPCFIHLLKGKH